MFTIVEIYNEADSRSINHHGSKRKVYDKNITEAQNGWIHRQTNVGDIAKFFGKSQVT